jgi:O-antigen ligase
MYTSTILLFLLVSLTRWSVVSKPAVLAICSGASGFGAIAAAAYALVRPDATSPDFHFRGIGTNLSAVYVCYVIGILIFASENWQRRWRYLAYSASFALFVVGLLTRSRTFFLGVLILLVAFIVIAPLTRARARAIYIMLAGMTVTIGASFAIGIGAVDRFIYISTYGFFSGRVQGWLDAVALFRWSPFCGIGLGHFGDPTFNPVYAARLARGEAFLVLSHAHNIFLTLAAEGGILMLAYLLFLIAGAAYFIAVGKRGLPGSPFAAPALAVILVFLGTGLIENTLFAGGMYLLAVFTGLTTADVLHRREPGRVNDDQGTVQRVADEAGYSGLARGPAEVLQER